mgnify:CR=1 FL=1|jgi:putative acetyltransferase
MQEIIKLKHPSEVQLDQLIDIWLTSNLEAHNFIDSKYWLDNKKLVRKAFLDAELYVVEIKQRIVGFAGLQDNYIAGIFINNDYRRQGIGHVLLNQLKQTHAQLTLSVYEKNEAAVQFYLKNGFKKSGQNVDSETGEIEYQMSWEV